MWEKKGHPIPYWDVLEGSLRALQGLIASRLEENPKRLEAPDPKCASTLLP